MTCLYFFSEKNMLSFYNVNDLGKNEATHTLDINVPGLLCPAGSSTLLYVDGQSSTPPEVCWLDCSTLPPNPIEDRKPINLPQELPLGDICVVNTGGKQYLVYASTTDAGSGIFSYMITSNPFEREIKQIVAADKSICIQGITSDGRGHIFASDYHNSCVFMVTLEGTLMGTVLDLKDVGKPGTLCWCESLSSLVVAYEKDKKWAIVTVKLGKVF